MRQKINFDITNLREHRIILRRRWLERENPQINWKNGEIHLRRRKLLEATTEREVQLPAHQLWDYKIKLKEGAQLKMGPIYKMLETELQAAKNFINQNLR